MKTLASWSAGQPKPSPKPAQEDCAADTSVVSNSYQANTADCSTIQIPRGAPMRQCIILCAPALNVMVIMSGALLINMNGN